ncbi:hypothetical protein FHS52_001117 [Erythromicrobium ramosum]|uniref:Uncharacterized protein n=1 Tax=Erythrobacter ramosus TaxID=35811 RepID=A0A6I4UFH6_9SPHN|nr:hypothetical protein [Erythrobacter ramosus]MBB3775174.1 hypothetical protein [Erythrobacter ramosus]MXP37198.1 hypothetical protein [Erythrobacter ramosus]
MALATDRNTPMRQPGIQSGLAAVALIHAGALVMRNAAGYITKGAAATGSVGVGRAEERVDNAAGSAGDLPVQFRPGTFLFKNSASTDEITIAQIGDICWIVDDETVAKTSNSAARSPAGFVADVDDQGVWVRFDEALTRVYVEGIANPV